MKLSAYGLRQLAPSRRTGPPNSVVMPALEFRHAPRVLPAEFRRSVNLGLFRKANVAVGDPSYCWVDAFSAYALAASCVLSGGFFDNTGLQTVASSVRTEVPGLPKQTKDPSGWSFDREW